MGGDTIRLATDRATKLTQQLLAFARKQRLEGRPINLNNLVDGMNALVDRTLGDDVLLQQHLAPDLFSDLIERELQHGPFHNRYSGMEREEGCFLACTFWLVEALVLHGERDKAASMFERALAALDRNSGTFAEMANPDTRAFWATCPRASRIWP